MNLATLKNIPPEKLFVVIDGSSYLFRAFYAPHLNALTATDGSPSGAIYGVLTMLKRLESLLPIHHQGGINAGGVSISACFVMDEKGGSFRNELYPEYKAQRGAPPDELISQIAPLKQIIRELGWSLLSQVGFEADDLIATLVAKAKAQGKISVIVTGDKDLAQLIDDQVYLLDTMKDEWLDREGVIKKFGVPPELIVDYLTLIGDASDNVPGVNKVGAKTAVKWLSEWGTLDNIMQHADQFSGVVGENLRQALPWLPTARRLITLLSDVALPEHFSPTFSPMNTVALSESYSRWGFKKMLTDITRLATINASNASSSSLASSNTNLFGEHAAAISPVHDLPRLATDHFICLNDEASLISWLSAINETTLLAIDTETTGLNPLQDDLVGISLCYDGVHAVYIPLAHVEADRPQLPLSQVAKHLAPIFANPNIPKCGHNLRFDRLVLSRVGLNLQGIKHDSALASFVLEGHEKHRLEEVAKRWIGLGGMSFETIVAQSRLKNNIAGAPIAEVTQYACEDAALTWRCIKHAEVLLSNFPKISDVYQLDIHVSDVLFDMELRGICINAELLISYSETLKARCAELEKTAHSIAGVAFNLASSKQLQEILFDRLGMTSNKKTQKGAISTNEEVLAELAETYPDQLLPRVILEYRQLSKLNNTYAEKLPHDINPHTGRVHTRFSQVGAITGRLASHDPNVQNIPVKTPEGRIIRTAFIPEKGWVLMSADYSQIELRVMAHVAGDEGMLHAFAQGADIHRMTASEVFEVPEQEVTADERRYAKAINFGLIYGMSAFGLAKAINVNRQEAKHFIDRYFSRYSAIKNWMEAIVRQAGEQGYVETLLGRRITINSINHPNAMTRQAAGRFAINAPIQGSAADIIKLAMVEVADWLSSQGLQSRLLLQVHDELVLECPPNEVALLQEQLPILMQKPRGRLQLKVPLEVNVGIGEHWGSAH